jgi:hypothetical protein
MRPGESFEPHESERRFGPGRTGKIRAGVCENRPGGYIKPIAKRRIEFWGAAQNQQIAALWVI